MAGIARIVEMIEWGQPGIFISHLNYQWIKNHQPVK
jgi:hypothetical protein